MEDTLWLSNVPMLISSKDENCTSPEVGGVVWIWKIFHECVASPVQYAGFILGLFSLMCWIVLFMPQIYKNIKEGKMDEGVSFFFIFIWMLGDISNLLGCILAHQLPIQHIIAYYYCGMDTLMLGQFTFYTLKKKRKLRAMRPVDTEDSSINRSSYNQSAPLFTICCFFVISFGSQLSWQQSGNVYESRQNAGGRMLLGSPVFYGIFHCGMQVFAKE
uniref:Lysosomal amino acid transporter 1 homolog n=1 Tax=Saccoglossus kowalevskii TaxID=10224 RepID=A0ABM0M2T5_SACKO|nr:PREDICTED: lysosomal amino acid transporter 1 homolog [Saccoglossus kowalevskii]